MAKFVDAKHRLMPYLYNLVRHSTITLTPLMFLRCDTRCCGCHSNLTVALTVFVSWCFFPGLRRLLPV